MDILAKFAASAAAPKSKSKPKPGVTLYASDVKQLVGYGLLGFLGFAGYHMVQTIAKRQINACADFIDPVESMNADPTIRDALLTLQNYRKLNPWLFRSAVQNIDQLLFLESALLAGDIKPVKNDKVAAFSAFRVGLNRLGQFQQLIKEKMGTEHAMAANLYVRKIYDNMQTHILNILHMCSDFKPEHLIERAPLEINKIVQAWAEGRAPESPQHRLRSLHKTAKHHSEEEPVSESESKTSKKSRRADSRKSRISAASRRT